tara:strand:+ start:2040 stop:3470 length:1431 start_codon:yes stop_codon:yes gene_type:complete
MAEITDLKTLAKSSVDSNDYFLISNSSTKVAKKIAVSTLFPAFATTGTSSENLWVSVTNQNQLNFKGIKSGDTGLLTVATTSNNIVLTALEAGIDLSLCNNTTAGFATGVDFTGIVTGECPVIKGGTGLSTIAKGAMLYASEDDVIAATSVMSTNGQILIGNATTGIPTLATLTAGTGMTITNAAGAITLASSISTLASNLDCANYDIDLGTGWLSGDGSHEGVNIDSDGKVFIGQSTPTAAFDDTLNIKGGIRFTNTDAPTIKPTATASSTAGQSVTIEGGSSASGNAGDLSLKGGTAASGGGNGGHVLVVAGSEAGGTAGSIKNSVYDGSGSEVQSLTVTGGSANPNVVVDKGNLVITEASKGIIHTGSGTVTQATDHTTGVTINTTSGVITLAAVALAATTNAEFTVTNSTVQADSVILVTMQDENTVNNKQLACAIHTVAGGSFKISIVNPHSATSTSTTASKIHFLVINNS